MKTSLINAVLLVTISINLYLSTGFTHIQPAVEQNFISINYGGKSAKLTGNDVNGALSHTKQLGISGNHYGNTLLVGISVQPYKLEQTGQFQIKYPTDGTTLMIMEDGQPLLVTKGKIVISSATKNHVTGSFSGTLMDGKTVSGTFGSRVVTAETARFQ